MPLLKPRAVVTRAHSFAPVNVPRGTLGIRSLNVKFYIIQRVTSDLSECFTDNPRCVGTRSMRPRLLFADNVCALTGVLNIT
jgi:hypothetical protein